MKQITRDLRYIHYWKKELSNVELQKWLDHLVKGYWAYWLVLLDEKLARNGF